MSENNGNATIMMIVRFKSRLSSDELERRYKQRLDEFRKLPGLLQKYYTHNAETGEYGGVYIWDSEASLQEYLGSELRKTIASAYEVEGAPRVEKLEIFDTLRPS